MKISCVVLTWNSEHYITRCLSSIIKALDCTVSDYEVFIVDNGSTDATPQILRQYQVDYPLNIVPIFLETNRGTTYSRNLALCRASGDVIAVIDSDVILPHKALPQLLSTLESMETVGMVVPRLVYGDGRFQKSTDHFPTIISKFRRYFFLKKMEQDEMKATTYLAGPVDYAISAFWLFRREVLDNVGLLDEKIFYAPEDVDYCLRIWKAGFRIEYIPSVTVIHDAQEISRGFRINKAFLEHIKGLCYFFYKHGYILKRPSFY